MKINEDLIIGNTNAKLSDIKTHNDKLYQVGWVINTNWSSATAQQSQPNVIQTLNIPKGIWLVFGEWTYEGDDLSTYTNINGITFAGATSSYDDHGWVNQQTCGLANSDGSQVAQLNVWPRNKTVTIKGLLWAIKISN